MNRAAMRKLVAWGKKAELGKPENWAALEEGLSGCRNGVTRAKLRSKIQRGASR